MLTNEDAIQVDGDLTDWRQVIGPPTLAMNVDMWGDVTEGDGNLLVPPTTLKSGLPCCRRIACSSPLRDRDTAVSDRVVDGWRDGQFEFMMEVAPPEVASNAATAQRVEVLPFAEGGLSVRYTGALAAWRNTTEYNPRGDRVGPTQGESRGRDARGDVAHRVRRGQRRGAPGERSIGPAGIGDVITLGVIGVDVDPCDWCVSVFTYPASHARDMQRETSGFGSAILTRLEPPRTVVSPSPDGARSSGS